VPFGILRRSTNDCKELLVPGDSCRTAEDLLWAVAPAVRSSRDLSRTGIGVAVVAAAAGAGAAVELVDVRADPPGADFVAISI
jgi:hypothetical protein